MRRALAIAACLAAGCIVHDKGAPPAKNAGAHGGGGAPWHSDFSGNDWLGAWNAQAKHKFALENLSVEEERGGKFPKFLRVVYPKGSSSPQASRKEGIAVGGAQFAGVLPESADHLFLRYYVRFPSGFQFVKGGKLPGFYGGDEISGGHIPDGTNGFSTRFMWRTDGQGEVYVYMPSSDKYGTSLGRGSFGFTPGAWQCIEQELTLNTPGRPDGQVRAFLDGKAVFEQAGLVFRTAPDLQIEGVLFSTFFGGADSTWATPMDTHVDFADFATAPTRIGCGGT
jgi:Polysaccharide lyase 14